MGQSGIPRGAKLQMVILAVFMPVFLILAVLYFILLSPTVIIDKEGVDIQDERTKPIGQLVLKEAKEEAKSLSVAETTSSNSVYNPESTYNSVCAACHKTGLLGAPKKGDKTVWGKRIIDNKNFDGLVASAIKGKGVMPPKGGANLSEEDFKTLVAYISGQESAAGSVDKSKNNDTKLKTEENKVKN